MLCKVLCAACAAFLVQLGQLARDRHIASGQDFSDCLKRLHKPWPTFVEDQRRPDSRKFGQHLASCFLLHWQETCEKKAVTGQT